MLVSAVGGQHRGTVSERIEELSPDLVGCSLFSPRGAGRHIDLSSMSIRECRGQRRLANRRAKLAFRSKKSNLVRVEARFRLLTRVKYRLHDLECRGHGVRARHSEI